nr:chloride channel protein [Actinopolymorpha pittospori]
MPTSLTSRRTALQVRPQPTVRTWLHDTSGGMAVLAVAIGAGAGVGAIGFRALIEGFTRLFSGHTDYSAAGHALNPLVPGLGAFFVVVSPVVAGLLYGPLVHWFAREARGHGVPEVMYAVAERGGRIPPQVTLVKAIASALCIGSGGSVGREGPIVQIGSALGSTAGRLVRMPEPRLRVLVACGAAGGIAATFNAPIAGPLFALELILRDFAVESFAAVVLASVTASVVGRAAFGDTAFLTLPHFTTTSPAQYLIFALLGLLVALVGVGFSRVLYLVEDLCDWAWRGPEWLRPAVGGLFLGGLLLVLPQMYGVGYPVLQHAVAGKYALTFLLLLLVGKVVATSLTIGIGGSGGVFAPSLFIGAMAGTAVGDIAHEIMPTLAGQPGMYGLLGMGAAFAAAARAPITAVIVLFELTGEYSIILPLMTAIVVATLVGRALGKDTIYTLKLRRRGIDLDEHQGMPRLAGISAAAVMEPLPEVLPADTDLATASRSLALSDHGILPVRESDGRYEGSVTAKAVAEALGDPESTSRTVADLVELPPVITTNTPLTRALDILVSAPGTGLPVLDGGGKALVGWITHQGVLGTLNAGTVPKSPMGAGSPVSAPKGPGT